VISEATRPLAEVLTVASVAIGLERVIIIGGFALQLGDHYLNILRNQLTKSGGLGTTGFGLDTIVSLGNGDEACLHGAAAFARSGVLEVA
jgi:glucokinase